MAGIVVDSSVLIDHLRGAGAATEFLGKERRKGPVLVPSLVAWELWKGAATPRQRSGVQELLTTLDSDPFGPAMAQLAGELHVLFHGLPLATHDRDYRGIPGLEVLRVA